MIQLLGGVDRDLLAVLAQALETDIQKEGLEAWRNLLD